MNNVVLLTHGEFSKGIAQSCEFILGKVDSLKALSISMDTSMLQAEKMLEETICSYGEAPVIIITDIAAGSTTQAGLQVLTRYKNVYLVSGLNLGLLTELLLTELPDNREECLKILRGIVQQARETITLVNDLADGEPEAELPEEDGEL